VVLRRKDPERRRPFRVPGGNVAITILATVTTAIIAGGILLFIWPEVPNSPAEWSYTGPLLGIVVVALAVGEVIVWQSFHEHHQTPVVHRGHPHGRPHLRHGRHLGHGDEAQPQEPAAAGAPQASPGPPAPHAG